MGKSKLCWLKSVEGYIAKRTELAFSKIGGSFPITHPAYLTAFVALLY